MNKLTLRKFIREILLEKWTKKYKKILIVLAQKDLVKRLIAQQEKKQRGKNTKSKHPLNEIENIKEQSINNFDRINFYLEYYTNNSPSSFKIIREGDKIKISNIV